MLSQKDKNGKIEKTGLIKMLYFAAGAMTAFFLIFFWWEYRALEKPGVVKVKNLLEKIYIMGNRDYREGRPGNFIVEI